VGLSLCEPDQQCILCRAAHTPFRPAAAGTLQCEPPSQLSSSAAPSLAPPSISSRGPTHRATARQCATRDWPVRQDQAHEAFCLREGYALGTRKATGLYTAY
jgi:hypothetical protein